MKSLRLTITAEHADIPRLLSAYGATPWGELAVALRPRDRGAVVVLAQEEKALWWEGADAPRCPHRPGATSELAARMQAFLKRPPTATDRNRLPKGKWTGVVELRSGGGLLTVILKRRLVGVGQLRIQSEDGVWAWRFDWNASGGVAQGRKGGLAEAIRAAIRAIKAGPGGPAAPAAAAAKPPRDAERKVRRVTGASFLSVAWLRAHPEQVHLAGTAGVELGREKIGGRVQVTVSFDGERLVVSPRSLTKTAPAARSLASLRRKMQRPSRAHRAPESANQPQAQTPAAAHVSGLPYAEIVGVRGDSPQWGLLGELEDGGKLALDLNHTHTISLFGVQGGGKSYTLGAIAEMASMRIPGINELKSPLATVIFHYSPTMDYAPEFTSMVAGNSDEAQRKALAERYGAKPKALSDVVLLVPSAKLAQRRTEFPGLTVAPLKFSSSELQASHWRFLIGAVGNKATYIRQLNQIMRSLRGRMDLEALREGIESSRMVEHLKEMAQARLDLASEYIDDSASLSEHVRPGRLVIVDARDEFIEKDEVLGLFVVLLQLFADATHKGKSFNKLVVFDEAHKYIESPELVAGLIETVREMRHKGTTILVASQDPPSVPIALIELSSHIILHKFNSPAWLKHLQKANAAFNSVSPRQMAALRPGEAFVWASKASNSAFTKGAVRVQCRPRVTQHGGATKTAVSL